MIFAQEAGWSAENRYRFDEYAHDVVTKFERMRDATIEKSAPRPRGKPRHTVRKPRYTEKELLAELDITEDSKERQRAKEEHISESAWATLDDGEWVSEPE